jgi:hypothetical protein
MTMNKNVKSFIVVLFLCISTIPCIAQHNIDTDLDDIYFQNRVKNIEDFINRFNYRQDAGGNLISYSDSLKFQRKKVILSLFSNELISQYYSIDSLGNIKSKSANDNLVENFLNFVVLDTIPQFLEMINTKWEAEAHCAAKFKGKNTSVLLHLNLVYNEIIHGAKWVIRSCESPCLSIISKDSIVLSPISHNMNFMDIGKAGDLYPDQMISFAFDGFKPDDLSLFFFAVKNKLLKVDYISDLSFHFFQIPGYKFTVKNYILANSHSGWLISGIDKIN